MLFVGVTRVTALANACNLPARGTCARFCSQRLHATWSVPAVAAATILASPSSSPSPVLRGVSAASAGLLHSTRLLRRPQTIKPNPNEATSGQFDKSFEKITETIESRLPFRQRHVVKGNVYDVNFGERTERDMYREAEEDLQGREREKPAARQARSYFSDEDLSPEALHVRSPHLKVAQNVQRQSFDKKILKTTTEPSEYYYPAPTKAERQKRTAMLAAGWGVVGVFTVVGMQKAAAYMRTAG